MTQLVQLQGRLGDLSALRTAVAGVSYDPVPVLAKFAERHGITFPLLSDEGSLVIERLGLLNAHNEQQAAHYGLAVTDRHDGLPYPGTFLLDEQGRVVEKRFEQSYLVRPQ